MDGYTIENKRETIDFIFVSLEKAVHFRIENDEKCDEAQHP